MNLTTEQLKAAEADIPVKIQTNGQTFYLLSQRAYERLNDSDSSPVTPEELDLLACEAADLIQDDLDEPL